MKQGYPVKLPSWGGYWSWENKTIMMHTKDGDVIDIRDTDRTEYTFNNIASDEFVIATKENTPLLGGEATFNFGTAIHYLKRGLKVARKGWNGKGMYLFLSPRIGCQMYEQFTGQKINDMKEFLVIKTTDGELVPWVASQMDVLAEDWKFFE